MDNETVAIQIQKIIDGDLDCCPIDEIDKKYFKIAEIVRGE